MNSYVLGLVATAQIGFSLLAVLLPRATVYCTTEIQSKLGIWKCRLREIGCVFADGGVEDYRVGDAEGALGLRMQPRQGDRRGQGGLCAPALSHTPFHLLLYGSTRAL